MNLLFLTVVVAVTAGFALHLRAVRSRRTTAVDSPVEAFSFTHRDSWPLTPDQWSLEDVQFSATSDRIRAAVCIKVGVDDQKKRRQAVEVLAHEIYRHTEVAAVFIEAFRPDDDPDLYLFAADGRGWWGKELVSNASN